MKDNIYNRRERRYIRGDRGVMVTVIDGHGEPSSNLRPGCLNFKFALKGINPTILPPAIDR